MLFFPHPVIAHPDIIQQHIEDRHADGRDQFSDSQGSCEITVNKIIQDARDQMKGISTAQNQCRKAHIFSGPVAFFSCLSQYQQAARNCKNQIQNIKSRFTIFHIIKTSALLRDDQMSF